MEHWADDVELERPLYIVNEHNQVIHLPQPTTGA
jgi:hypothetical protein